MKKSKVIIPAMALLLFSTAASITGTVAWFTSSRTFDTSAGTFQATAIDGNLDVDLAEGVATDAVTENGQAPGTNEKATKIVAESGAKFADVSFQPKPSTGDSTFWRYTPSGQTTFTSLGLGSGLTFNATSKIYFAASWTMTFKYTYGEDSSPMNIFLDTRIDNSDPTIGSKFTETGTASTEEHQAIKGFRIAFVSGTGTAQRTVIWADKQAETNCKHIASASSATAGTTYTEPNTTVIASDARDSALVNDNGAITNVKGYIGQIPTASAGQTGQLAVTCYAWFEGTDPNVVNDAKLNICSATMKFYARTAAA